jgi:alpha-N-acetylglucosamine transferase
LLHETKLRTNLLEDFLPAHKVAIVTLIIGDVTYVKSSIALALSIKHGKDDLPLDLVVLEIESRPLLYTQDLDRVGWKRCKVKRIPPPRVPHQKFLDQFTKLYVWNMTFYDSIIYMDSDTFVIGSIDDLMALDFPRSKYPIAATRDFRGNRWQDTFNLGVFKIYPSQREFYRLLDRRDKNDVEYEAMMCEQSWLNKLYPQWFDFGMENNFNIYAAVKSKRLLQRPLQIIHFTMPKPWECNKRLSYNHVQHLCDMWKQKVNEFWGYQR